jgi:hypothetical protein
MALSELQEQDSQRTRGSLHPSLYQVNTRVLLRELSGRLGRPATLDDIPDRALDVWAATGFEWLWLLSVWQTGLAGQGFRGRLRVVSEWATRRRQAEKADGGNLSRAPSARTIARLMTIGRDALSKAETITVAAIEQGVPLLVEAREIIAAFQAMVRKKSLADLESWLGRARSSLVASFANGVTKDQAAVSAAITLPWSNGQTEGQITKLKLVKRQMYGRGKLDLLQARVIGAG